MDEKSCYVVELSVEPGGSRRGDVIAVGTKALVKKVLEREFRNPDPMLMGIAASMALGYGETILVWVVQQGNVAAVVDVHPFLTAHTDGLAPARLDDRAACKAVAKAIACGDYAKEGAKVRFTLDWKGLDRALPALEGRTLRRSDAVALDFSHVNMEKVRSHLPDGTDEPLPWGYSDLENGELEAPPMFEEFQRDAE